MTVAGVLVVVAVLLFCMAGLGLRWPRFAPEWFAFAVLTVALVLLR